MFNQELIEKCSFITRQADEGLLGDEVTPEALKTARQIVDDHAVYYEFEDKVDQGLLESVMLAAETPKLTSTLIRGAYFARDYADTALDQIMEMLKVGGRSYNTKRKIVAVRDRLIEHPFLTELPAISGWEQLSDDQLMFRFVLKLVYVLEVEVDGLEANDLFVFNCSAASRIFGNVHRATINEILMRGGLQKAPDKYYNNERLLWQRKGQKPRGVKRGDVLKYQRYQKYRVSVWIKPLDEETASHLNYGGTVVKVSKVPLENVTHFTTQEYNQFVVGAEDMEVVLKEAIQASNVDLLETMIRQESDDIFTADGKINVAKIQEIADLINNR
jgi:hypothetical protein